MACFRQLLVLLWAVLLHHALADSIGTSRSTPSAFAGRRLFARRDAKAQRTNPYGSYQSRDVSHFKKSNAILQQGKPIGEEGPPSLSFASPGATSFVGEVYYNEGEGSSAKMSFKDEAVAQMQASPATIAHPKPQLDFEQCHKPKRFFGRGRQNILLESIVVCVFGLFLLRETAKTSAWLDLSD